MVNIVINCRRNVDMKRLTILMNNASEELKKRIIQIFRRKGLLIQKDAQANASVKTGEMRDLIICRDTPTGVEIIGAAPHTGYQELGTKYIQGKHFMKNAFDAYHPIISHEIQQTIIDYFKEVTD